MRRSSFLGWLLPRAEHGLLAASVLTVVLAAAGSITRAQESQESSDDSRARERFEAGRAHYDAGRVAEALADFEAAFELSPRPLLLYNIYLCRLDLGDVQQAAATLRRYLAEGTIDPADRASLEARLVALERRTVRHARAVAPERVRTTEPSPPTGHRRVFADAAAEGGGPNVGAWTVVGLGAVATITSIVLLAVAQTDIDDVENATRWSEVEGSYQRAPIASGAGLGVGGVGLAALGTGVVWLVAEGP